MGRFEELFEVLRGDVEGVTRGFFDRFVGWVGEFDGANGTEGTFITEDEINGFIFDKTLGGLAVLRADFVIEESRDFNLGDDIEFLAKKFD